ncbi:MAG: site-specific integrase [Ekhidna sp.]
MASIELFLWKYKKKKDGTCPITVRIIKDRKPKYIYTGYYLLEKDWNADTNKVKKSYPNSARLNNLLRKKLAEANNIALEAETNEDSVSSKEIKKKVARKGRTISFFQYGYERIKGKHNGGVYSVARAERSILCNIEEFVNRKPSEPIDDAKRAIQERRKKRIGESRKTGYSFLEEIKSFNKNNSLYFEDINTAWINQFKIFCTSYLEMKKRTVTNQLIFIRTLFNEAISEGIVDAKHYPFAGEKEKIRLGSGHKIGLSKKEVEQIESLKLNEGDQIWHAKNVWLLAYYFAGIRISDVLSLKWGDFKDGRLFYTMHKNDKPVSLKIPEKAQAILDLYKTSSSRKKDFIFDYLKKADVSSSHDVFVKSRNATSLINKYLKRIAEMCGIDKSLSNHIARHTFGNIAGDRIHPLMLQKLYRHSDLKTTINYQANFIHKEADDALDSVIG